MTSPTSEHLDGNKEQEDRTPKGPLQEHVFAECSRERILGLLAAMLPPTKSVTFSKLLGYFCTQLYSTVLYSTKVLTVEGKSLHPPNTLNKCLLRINTFLSCPYFLLRGCKLKHSVVYV